MTPRNHASDVSTFFEALEPRLLLSASSWPIEVVDAPGNVGLFTSLAIEGGATPDKHISYYDETNGDLKYARWDSGTETWSTETVDSTGDVGQYTAIAVNAAGRPRISYYDVTNGALKYAAWNGATWDIETVDNTSLAVGQFTSLALTTGGNACISYYDAAEEDLKYASWSGAVWNIETVDGTNPAELWVGSHTSLALNAADRPRISYHSISAGNLKYAAWDGAAWDIETVDTDADAGRFTSLALDESDKPRISYTEGSVTDLGFAWWSDGAWHQSPGPDGVDNGRGLYTSLAVNAAGQSRISHLDGATGDLRLASWRGAADGDWVVEVVDNVGWDVGTAPGMGLVAGLSSSIAVGADGKTNIAYYNYTNGNLNFTVQNYWPTLTTVSTLTGAAENTPFTITYATLAAAADEGDPEGAAISFRIESVTAGTLTKGGVPVTAGTTLLGAGEELVWTPADNTNGDIAAFTIKAWDGHATSEDPAVAVTVSVEANEPPTLTWIDPLSGASVGVPFTITHADLLAAAVDESDPEGAPISFRIEQVNAGTLTKGGAPVIPGTTLLGPGEEIIWTPDAAGTTEAFTVKAWDGYLPSADPAVNVTVAVDIPILTFIDTLTGASAGAPFTITHADLLAAAVDEFDPEGGVVSFRIEQVNAGSLTKGGIPVTPGTTLLGPGEEIIWTPDAAGTTDAFTVKAWNGFAASADPAVDVTVAVDIPILTFIDTLTGASAGAPFTITHADLLAAAVDEFDPEGGVVSFRIEQVNAGSLTKGGIPVTPGTTLLGPGEEIIWTPDAAGTTDAFTVKAWNGFAASADPAVDVTIAVDLPILTLIDILTGASVDTPFTITHADLLTAAVDEFDPEGGVLSFRIEQVKAGTLTKGGFPVTAGTTLLGPGEEIIWTPDAPGTTDAFTVKVWNGFAASADPAVDVTIAVNQWPTLTTVNTLHGATKDTAFTITYAALAAAADEADADGDAISFVVQAVTNGTLTKGGVPVVPGTTTLATGESLVWTPPAGFTGEIEAFTIVAHDGLAPSADDVAVDVDVSPALGLVVSEVGLPTQLTPGSKKNGVIKKLNTVVTNNSAALVPNVELTVYASLTGTMNDATELATVAKRLKLKPGQAKKLTFKKIAAPVLPLGSYHLVVDGELTNPVSTTALIQWLGASVDLTGTVANSQFRVDDRSMEKVYAVIQNSGNSDVRQQVRIELYGSTDQTLDAGTDMLLDTYDKTLNLAGGKSKKVKLAFLRQDLGLGDNFYLILLIDASDAVAESNELNNEAIATATVNPEID